MKHWILLTTLALAGLPLLGQSTPDQNARFLEGMSVSDPALQPLTEEVSWLRHQHEFNKSWNNLENSQLSRIRAWTPLSLGNDATSRDPLFYLFSGPDFLYANALFPNASTYVFCGLEPVGPIPDVRALSRSALAASLANLRKSLNAVLSFSFFLTKDMKVDLSASMLSGTLPPLYVFMARSGNAIKRVELVNLADDGELVADKAATSGVRLVFSRGGGPDQTLYYFSTDLSDSGIKHRPGFVRFCAKQGQGNSLVKAASYLMHMSEFSDVRGFLLDTSKTIVQDDSGIPYKYFAQDKWDVLVVGRYPGPIKLFENRYQPDLMRAFRTSNPPPLTFSFGYRWRPSESSVIVATSLRYVPKAIPVANE